MKNHHNCKVGRSFSFELRCAASTLAVVGALAAFTPAFAQQDAELPRLEEIVVTAQKRSQNVEHVPISVSAVSAKMLEAQGVDDSASLSASVPGLQLNRSFRGGTPFIRGIGNPSGATGDEGAVAFYVDGVYQTNLIASLFEFNNVERIEVLKGPQGTLFGRNALGGVIQVITRDPPKVPTAEVRVGAANYDTYRASLYAGGPLSDTLAADIAVQGFNQGKGWGKNLMTGHEVYKSNDISARSKLVWTPTDATKLSLSAQYGHNQDFSTGSHLLTLGLAGARNPGRFNVQVPLDPKADVNVWGMSLKAEQDLGFGRLVNVLAYGETNFHQRADLDSQPLNLVQLDFYGYDKAWTNELQLLSPESSKVSWVAGLFYLFDRTGYERPQGWLQTGGSLPGGFFNRFGWTSSLSYAGYAQATVPVLENVWPDTHLTGGIRYTSERRGLSMSQFPLATGFRVKTSVKYTDTSYRLAVDHQFDDDRMIYASYTTGFKSGLYNTNAPLDAPVRPETVGAFEAGFKTKWLDRRLLVDAAVFHYTFDDIQLRKPTGSAGGTTSLLNAAKGKSQGINVSVQAIVTNNLSIQSGFEVLSTEYTRFPNAPISYLSPAVCTPTPGSTGAPVGGTIACVGNATGNDMIQSPPFSANFGAQYTIPVGDGQVALNAQYSYTDSFAWEADNRLQSPAHGMINAGVRWIAPGGRWELSLWGKNLSDEAFPVNSGSLPFGDITLDAPPRTYGMDLTVRFGD